MNDSIIPSLTHVANKIWSISGHERPISKKEVRTVLMALEELAKENQLDKLREECARE